MDYNTSCLVSGDGSINDCPHSPAAYLRQIASTLQGNELTVATVVHQLTVAQRVGTDELSPAHSVCNIVS